MRAALILCLMTLAALHLLLPVDILQADPSLASLLLVELRLPRTLLVIGYGATLGLTGAALQTVFANPLASPDISGASSGAVLAAVLGTYWLAITDPILLALLGTTGALMTLALLLLIAGRNGDQTTLLLGGVALSLALGAATSLALALAPSPFAFYDAFDWLMGGFADRSLGQAAAALIPALIASAWLLGRSNALDLLALGDDVASSLGVRPKRLATETIVASSIAVGACVSVCGAIGFVGLAAPVIARRVVRGHPGRALAPAAALGALLLLLADMAVRLLPLNRTLPIGVLTALFGSPLFFWMVIRARRSVTS
ncbi:iron ABC transporter permease [Sphingomonas rhizophila]|uniref:Iron ABC transporter permease n=1 Tax=Sphingomonas rhizophila TaxID=2071607 RepID=A0A7G9SDH9_9SPHN|nr:iron ABC transporter permease [Sphingomonas rhizophila]QNN65904.1 iron ABC transporter permease [Sphingomonas rhizophila]